MRRSLRGREPTEPAPGRPSQRPPNTAQEAGDAGILERKECCGQPIPLQSPDLRAVIRAPPPHPHRAGALQCGLGASSRPPAPPSTLQPGGAGPRLPPHLLRALHPRVLGCGPLTSPPLPPCSPPRSPGVRVSRFAPPAPRRAAPGCGPSVASVLPRVAGRPGDRLVPLADCKRV